MGVCHDPEQEIGVGDIAMIVTNLPEAELALPPLAPATKCLPAWRSTRRAHRFAELCHYAPICVAAERVLW